MFERIKQNDTVGSYSRRQQLFFRYTLAVLIDLTVLNLFDQYWDLVYLESFSISLAAALLLQLLLQATLVVEHRIAAIFKGKPGVAVKIKRGLATWAVLFGSKLVILEAINFFFGDSVRFTGPVHGLVSFITVVIAIIVAEQLFAWIYRRLAGDEDF